MVVVVVGGGTMVLPLNGFDSHMCYRIPIEVHDSPLNR